MTKDTLTTEQHLDRQVAILGVNENSTPSEIREVLEYCFGCNDFRVAIGGLRPRLPNFLASFYYALVRRIFIRFETDAELTFDEWIKNHGLQLDQIRENNNEPNISGDGNIGISKGERGDSLAIGCASDG